MKNTFTRYAPFILLFFFLPQLNFAQEHRKYGITGIVVDMQKDYGVLDNVDVIIRSSKDSTLVNGTVTNNDGFFEFNNIKSGSYNLSIYEYNSLLYSNNIDVVEVLELDTIRINYQIIQLDEVLVQSTQSRSPTIQREADRTIVNVLNTVYENGENGYSLLNIVPEVRTDGLGNINFRGQQGVIVYVDNRRIRLEGQQQMTYLKSLLSESIEKIEISSIPGANYEAEGVAAIINIITKKEHRFGLTGVISTYFQQHRFPGTGAGAVLNYKQGKWNFHLSYNYSLFNFFNDIDLSQTYLDEEPKLFFNQKDFYKERYNSHNSDFGVDFDLSKNQKIGLTYNLNYVDWTMRYNSRTNVFNQPSIIDSVLTTTTREKEFLNDQSINAFYELKTDSLGSKLILDYAYIEYKNPSDAYYLSEFLDSNNNRFRDNDSSFIYNPINVNIHTARLDFEKKSKKFALRTGSKFSFINTNNKNLFFSKDGESIIVDNLKSNQFVYNENIYAFYASLSHNWKKWEANLGLRLENTEYSGESVTINESFDLNRVDLFPSFFLQRSIGENHLLNLSLGRRIQRPSYEYLNPFIDYENPYSFTTGNPNLAPAFRNSAELIYLYKNQYTFNLGMNRTTDIIGEIYFGFQDTPLVISTYDNLNSEDYYFLSTSIPVEITKWYSINNYINFYRKVIDINEQRRKQNTVFFYSSHNFSLPKKFFIELNGYYQTKSITSIYETNPQAAINLTLKKSFWNERIDLNLNFNDIFYTQPAQNTSNFDGILRVNDPKFTSRIFKMGISYNFKKGKKNTNRGYRETINSEEKERIE